MVDDEQQTEENAKRLAYDWSKLKAIDESAAPPTFVFNSGQWFGTAGLLTREDFAPWVRWDMPRTLRHPDCFMPGDQGILNYVLNAKARLVGLKVTRRKFMHWPGHGMGDLDHVAIEASCALPRVVHWAGLKGIRYRDIVGYEVLEYFERLYYTRLPYGKKRRRLRAIFHVLGGVARLVRTRARLRMMLLLKATRQTTPA